MGKFAGYALIAGILIASARLVTVRETLYQAAGMKFNGMASKDLAPVQTAENSNTPAQSLVVPPSTTGLTLRDVQANAGSMTTSSNVMPIANQATIQISDVIGLADELAARPVKGTMFANNRVVVSSASGSINAALGSTTDCVRVDGTSTPCGAGAAFTDGEAPAGTINGANNLFTLAGTPNPAASLALFRNGIIQKQGLDYTSSANKITFVSAATPLSGDVLIANYRGVSAGVTGFTVDSILIWNRTDCCGDLLSDYWVFVSNTPFGPSDTPATLQNRAGTWSSHQTSAPKPSTTIAAGGVQGRYVRVQLTGTNYLSLAEVQVMGTSANSVGLNMAQGKTASQSSTIGGYPTAGAGSAVDGITDGNWWTAGSTSLTNWESWAWWQVDLGT